MPYDVIQENGKYNTIDQKTGKVLGTHDTRDKAESQMRAIGHEESRRANPLKSPGTKGPGKTVLNSSYEPVPISEVYVDGHKVNTE